MNSDKKEPNDFTSEAMVIGSLYKNPELYIVYGNELQSNYFTDPLNSFFFEAFETYYTAFSRTIREDGINMFMLQNEYRKQKYSEFGGWETVSKMMESVNLDEFDDCFKKAKKFAILRKLTDEGYDTECYMDKKNFDNVSAEDIVESLLRGIYDAETTVGIGVDSSILGANMVERVEQWMETPAMGIKLPFPSWNKLFYGMRKKKLIIDGMLSNEGKSRKMIFVAAYIGLVLDKKILIMANEMDADDYYSVLITTVCNNKEFGFEYNIPERNIVMNEYDSEEQREQALEVAEYIESHTNLNFKDMEDYCDESIEHEMRKHVLALGVEYVFYDTLKGYRADDWSLVKQTCTKFKELLKELNIGGYATIQLTDKSLNQDIFDYSSNNIANSKQIMHVADSLVLGKRLTEKEYEDCFLVTKKKNDKEKRRKLKDTVDKKFELYGQKIVKNRVCQKGVVSCIRVNHACNTWKEIGKLVRKDENAS